MTVGTDSLCRDMRIECGAERWQVQVSVDAAELLAGLDHQHHVGWRRGRRRACGKWRCASGCPSHAAADRHPPRGSVPRARIPVGLIRRLPVALTHADPETLSFLSTDPYPTPPADELAR